MADLSYTSRYPFSAEAKEFIRSRRLAPDYDSIQKAKEHITRAITDGRLEMASVKVESMLEQEIFD